MIETSTLTEEGVMQVKTEVRREESSDVLVLVLACSPRCWCVSGLRPPPGHACGDKDEGQEGP